MIYCKKKYLPPNYLPINLFIRTVEGTLFPVVNAVLNCFKAYDF